MGLYDSFRAAERERQDGGGGESAVLDEHASRVRGVLPELLEKREERRSAHIECHEELRPAPRTCRRGSAAREPESTRRRTGSRGAARRGRRRAAASIG